MPNKKLWDGVDGVGIYAQLAKHAVKDANGNVIDSTYATKTELSDKQDSLTFGYNSNSQIVSIDSHDLAPSTDSTVYLATYNATRGDAVSAALLAGKAVMCSSVHEGDSSNPKFGLLGTYNISNNQYQYTFIRKTTNTYEQAMGDFAFGSVFNSSAGNSWYGQFYNLTFKAPTAAGQVMKSVSVNNSHYDWALSTVREVPSSTSSDENKVLTVNSQGDPEWASYTSTDNNFTDALKSKLDGIEDGAEKNVQANWWTDDESDPSYIQHKPTLYTAVNYDDEHYRQDAGKQPPYVYNCHEITADEITNKQFVLKLPLGKTNSASNITLMGDIYSIRGLTSLRGSSNNTIDVTSSNVASIDIALGDYDSIFTNEPVIRHIDSSEFAKSDRNVSSNMSQCRFHFTHLGSCTSSATRINTDASYLHITVKLTSDTNFVAGNVFQVLATWVIF